MQHPEPLADKLEVRTGVKGGIDVHVHQFRKRMEFSGGVLPPYVPCDFRISGSTAIRARDIHIRKKLHIKAYHACAVTGRTPQLACIV